MSIETDTQFRPARQVDWPRIRALLGAANLPLAGAEDHLADYIVAESAGELVACAGLEIHGDAALLRSCAVDERFRQRGLGCELVKRVTTLATSRGIRELFLLTTTAETYFSRRGFQPISRDEVAAPLKASQEFRGACPDSACVMHRQIAP